ncbi:MAG: hypothetical protein ACI4O9_02290 [Akkermansia sp.]
MKKSILIALFAAMPLFAQEAAPEAAAPAPAPEAAAAPEAGQPGCGCRRHHGQRPELTEEQKAEFRARMLEKFDTNKDGQLDEQEKEAMRAAHRAHRGEGRCGKGPRPEGKPGCCPKGPRPEGKPGCCPKGPRPEGKCGCPKGPRPEGKPGCCPKGPRPEGKCGCPKGPRPECKPAPEAAPAEAPAPAPEA